MATALPCVAEVPKKLSWALGGHQQARAFVLCPSQWHQGGWQHPWSSPCPGGASLQPLSQLPAAAPGCAAPLGPPHPLRLHHQQG